MLRKAIIAGVGVLSLLSAGVVTAQAKAPTATCTAFGLNNGGLSFVGSGYAKTRAFTILENNVPVAGPERPGASGELTLFQLKAPVGVDTITVERPDGSVASQCSATIA